MRSAVEALAGARADRHLPDAGQRGARELGARLGQGRRGIGQVGPGDDQQPTAYAQGRQRGEVLGRLRHPAVVGRDHEQHHAGAGPTPASVVAMNRSWPGTSTKATSPTPSSEVQT